MKIGYPCINLTLDCRSSKTFRLKNYSHEKLINIIEGNLECLFEILKYNVSHDFYFFRITSDLIPFASHPIMDFNWQDYFKLNFRKLGNFIKENKIRISMHPGQYTVLNSNNQKVFQNSIKDLEYHVEILDLMALDKSAKIQIHIGGVYNNKKTSLKKFINRYFNLEERIKNRLIIENDDKSYNLDDCLEINKAIGIPIAFDIYHHECLHDGKDLADAFNLFTQTWDKDDGIPIIHYSSEHPIKGKCSHAKTIDLNHFENFLVATRNFNFDMMFEIKDKEKSVLKALELLRNDPRFNKNF